MSIARTRFISVLVVCGLAAVAPLPALAGSSQPVPCYEQLLNESYSGQITTIYPHQCYVEALKKIPPEAQIYGNEKQQIQQAMALAAQNKLPPSTGVGPTSTAPASHSWLWKAIHKFDPGSADAFPTPLLILGALAILLVIAGIAGMLWQRSHPRDSAPPAPSSDPPAPS
jgi:hypothetical protein